METPDRVCCKCRKRKPLDEFVRSKGRCGGYIGTCMDCRKDIGKDWKSKNRSKNYAIQLKYRLSTSGYYTRLRSSARHKGTSFDITREEFCSWFDRQDKVCYYCGIQLIRGQNERGGLNNNHVTIDRKNNKRGYSKKNIALCCKRCNMIKGEWFTEAEMKEIADKFLRKLSDARIKS